jgi:hypothetical protein
VREARAERRRAREARERREAARKRRAAARARKAQAIANAQAIPYKQLAKNPDSYSGKLARYTGKILQIQEEGNTGFMLLSVTDMGYDVWTDEIYVAYRGSIPQGEGDMATVVGEIQGGFDYETKIGGTNSVPALDAEKVTS